jgi:hypothetical protein
MEQRGGHLEMGKPRFEVAGCKNNTNLLVVVWSANKRFWLSEIWPVKLSTRMKVIY